MSALWLTLSEVADLTGGRLHLADPAELVTAPVVIDNRIVEPGGLFAAFVGEKVDGHDFAESAVAAGAVAVLGSRATAVPTVIVDDGQRALQALAREVVRRRRAQPEPFTVMALTLALGRLLDPPRLRLTTAADGGRERTRGRSTVGVVVVGSYLVLALIAFAFFWPIWTDALLTHQEWTARMWFARWI